MLEFLYGAAMGLAILCACATIYMLWVIFQILRAADRVDKEWSGE